MKFNFFENFRKKEVRESEKNLTSVEAEIKKETEHEESWLKTPMEKILESREKNKSESLNGGCNETILVNFRDDGSGVFKPKSGEMPDLRTEVKTGTFYKRERAAYLVNKFLGFDLVPPTVIRKIDEEIGSVQQFVKKAKTYTELDLKEKGKIKNEEIMKLWLFDFIIWNSDRSSNNFMIKDHKIFAIDNGLSFGKDSLNLFESYFPDGQIPETIIKKFKEFFAWDQGKKILSELLSELLDKKEVDACLKRIKLAGKYINNPKKIPSASFLKF